MVTQTIRPSFFLSLYFHACMCTSIQSVHICNYLFTYVCIYKHTYTQRHDFLGWARGERAMPRSPGRVCYLNPASPLSLTQSVCLFVKVLPAYMQALHFFPICVLTNSLVDKRHLSWQKKSGTTKTLAAMYLTRGWPCVLPDFRKENTCSAWLRGGVSVHSDNKVLLKTPNEPG